MPATIDDPKGLEVIKESCDAWKKSVGEM